MGVEIVAGFCLGDEDRLNEVAVLTCNTTNMCFGPLFDGAEEAQAFMRDFGADPRNYQVNALMELYALWRAGYRNRREYRGHTIWLNPLPSHGDFSFQYDETDLHIGTAPSIKECEAAIDDWWGEEDSSMREFLDIGGES